MGRRVGIDGVPPAWGLDPGTAGFFAWTDTPVIVRCFLPLQTDDGAEISWTLLAQLTGTDGPDSRISLRHLTEFPGSGAPPLVIDRAEASGRFRRQMTAALLDQSPRCRWSVSTLEPQDIPADLRCRPPNTWSTSVRPVSIPSRTGQSWDTGRVAFDFDESYGSSWAWCTNEASTVSVVAPVEYDSWIVAGPTTLLESLKSHGIECAAVAAGDPLPDLDVIINCAQPG